MASSIYTTGPPYRHYTDTEIDAAKDTDLPELLASLGYQVRRRQLRRRVDGLDAAALPGGAAHAVDGINRITVAAVRQGGADVLDGEGPWRS